MQDFFASRAATWDDRFPDDARAFELAATELAPVRSGVVIDVGCGTGRALPFLRALAGPQATVVGLDFTAEMLAQARGRGRETTPGGLIHADAARLPLRHECCDALFAAGLLHHLPDPIAGLREFARVCRPGARLALFHPIGRVALAARHGGVPAVDDIRGEAVLRAVAPATGWQVERVDDGPDRYLALAVRAG